MKLFLNRYNRARRIQKRELARGNNLINKVGPADVTIEKLLGDGNPRNLVYVKPEWVSTPAKRRKFRRERAGRRLKQ